MNVAKIAILSLVIILTIDIFVLNRQKTALQLAPAAISQPVALRVQLPQAVSALAPESSDEVPSQKSLTDSNATPVAQASGISSSVAWDEMLQNLRQLAATNREAALKQVLQWPEGPERSRALENVCLGIADTDPAAALEIVQQLSSDERLGGLMGGIVQQWANSDVASAYDWVNKQPAGEQHDDLLMRVTYIYAQSNPANAANLVVKEMQAGETQIEAAMTVIHQWALRDLSGAANWVQVFPDGLFRERAVKELEGIRQYQKLIEQP